MVIKEVMSPSSASVAVTPARASNSLPASTVWSATPLMAGAVFSPLPPQAAMDRTIARLRIRARILRIFFMKCSSYD